MTSTSNLIQALRQAVLRADDDKWDQAYDAYRDAWLEAYKDAFASAARRLNWKIQQIEGWLDGLPVNAFDSGSYPDEPDKAAREDLQECQAPDWYL